jgi:hypothetical protein
VRLGIGINRGVFRIFAGYRFAVVVAIGAAWWRSSERERRLSLGFSGFAIVVDVVREQRICKKTLSLAQ